VATAQSFGYGLDLGACVFAYGMNYDLAKELKDAGFPQGGNGSWTGSKDKLVWLSRDLVYVPTFSELFDVCGRELFVSCGKDDCVAIHYVNGVKYQGLGATPEEAAARLWLAMQNGV